MESAKQQLDERVRGFGMVASVCLYALVNEPDEQVVDAVRRTAQALGVSRFDGVEPDAALLQRYYDRFFVSASPFYVPLEESCMRGAWELDGRSSFGSANGPASDHALRCYRVVGFDYRALEGFGPAVQQLRPDSMASELAFMASLARAACDRADHAAAARSEALLRQFAREHACGWFDDAADAVGRTADDFYSGVCRLAADAVDALRE